MKVEKERLEKNLVNFYLRMVHKINVFIFEKDKYDNYNKELEDKIKYDNYNKELEDKIKCDIYLKELVAKIEDESLDIKIIYEVLDRLNLEFEIDEDLFDEKKAFIYIYCVYYFYGTYLKE